MYIYIYIYIYTCVCVYLCKSMFVCMYSDFNQFIRGIFCSSSP